MFTVFLPYCSHDETTVASMYRCTSKPISIIQLYRRKRIIKTLFSLETDPTEMSLLRQNDSKLFTFPFPKKVTRVLPRGSKCSESCDSINLLSFNLFKLLGHWGVCVASKNATPTAELEPRTDDDYCARWTMDEMVVLGSFLDGSWSGLGAFLRLGLSLEAGMNLLEWNGV
ncbi:hypothetical protein HHX47_DHR6000536 [Lentinula edodes]|nr:hypothetical protein HHX47_DHR6000536 [Lentinula edodes]